MKYQEPGCAYCPPNVRACKVGESDERGPGFCPSKVDGEALDDARARYDDPELLHIAQVSAEIEAEGYCKWTRVEEVCHFARKMGFERIGIATCISFVDHAKTLSGILESHGFEVASVACKSGGVAKEDIGLEDSQKIFPGGYESMCNPVAQAEFLNRAGCQLNVVLGLCIGHDSLFFRHAEGLTTVLVAKDRVLAHNPIGALNLADTYYDKVWGPERPAKPPKLPAAGRKKD
jgi:uncharacterized metal-binding protein